MANKSKTQQKSKSQPQKSGTKPSGKSTAQKKPVHKVRGFWLTAALVLMIVTGLAAAIFFYAAKTPQVDRTWILTM
ncbi:MAG: hypothetical protein EHM38_08455, partial [Geobacteraceae bacterium]